MARTRAILPLDARTFELRDAADAATRGRRVRFDSSLEALLWLRRASTGAGAERSLRRFLAEGGIGGAALQTDDEVLRQLAGLLASGRAIVVEQPTSWLSSFGETADAASAAPSEAAEQAPASEPRSAPRRTWITIELIGEDDKPIPGERYRIALPDGSTREGRLDAQGLARVFEIDPGQCTVTFPDLDEEAWTSIGTTGEP